MKRVFGVVVVMLLSAVMTIPASMAGNCVNEGGTEPFGVMESPVDGYVAINPKDVLVSGWALSSICINRIKLFVDDIDLADCTGDIFLTEPRYDVCTYFCRENYPDCRGECPVSSPKGISDITGWKTVIDVTGFNIGWHTLKAVAYDDSGRSNVIGTIRFLVPRPFGAIDAPHRIRCGEDCQIRGWSLAGLGLEKVKIYFNDDYLGDARLSQSRPDLCGIYGGFVDPLCQYSGWTFDMHVSSDCVAPANKIYAVAVDKLGNETPLPATHDTMHPVGNGLTVRVDCTCDPFPPFGSADVPLTGQVISKARYFSTSGWALSDCTVDNVGIYLDGVFFSFVDGLRMHREDICDIICYPDCADAAWEKIYRSDDITLGTHDVQYVAMDTNGQTTVLASKALTVRNVQLPKGVVEYPPADQIVVLGRDALEVSGWALADRFDGDPLNPDDPYDPEVAKTVRPSVAKIEFYLDTLKIGTLNSYNSNDTTNSLGIARADVCAAPGCDSYQYPKCWTSGFNFRLADTSDLKPGATTLRVRVYDNKGLSNDIGSIRLVLTDHQN